MTAHKTTTKKTAVRKPVAKRPVTKSGVSKIPPAGREKASKDLSWTEARKMMDDLIKRNAKALKKLASL
jgi:hypothetical protein